MLIDDNMALHIEMHIWQTFLVISNTNFVIQKRCVRLGLVICILAWSKDEIQHMSQGKETLEKSAKTSKVKKIICQQKKDWCLTPTFCSTRYTSKLWLYDSRKEWRRRPFLQNIQGKFRLLGRMKKAYSSSSKQQEDFHAGCTSEIKLGLNN